MKKIHFFVSFSLLTLIVLSSCAPASTGEVNEGDIPLKVLAAESFIADMAQNVTGDRITVETLIPLGMDPHGFEPSPQDVAMIADSNVLIINGTGFEEWLQDVIDNTGGSRIVIDSTAGLTPRDPKPGELAHEHDESDHDEVDNGHHHDVDPHFWLDPISAIEYVENIRDGLIQADPEGAEFYTANANAYILQLKELDETIRKKVSVIPVEQRLLVTNHESFGYYADRYGFQIIGTIIPSVSTNSSPSAQQLAELVDHIKETGAIAIFMEPGTNTQLADQISSETGIKVIRDLYTHSITHKDGNAPTYIDMILWNTDQIIKSLGK